MSMAFGAWSAKEVVWWLFPARRLHRPATPNNGGVALRGCLAAPWPALAQPSTQHPGAWSGEAQTPLAASPNDVSDKPRNTSPGITQPQITPSPRALPQPR